MKAISKRQILRLHDKLIIQTGGSDGLRDEGLLESALAAPFASYAGQELYPSLIEKAARLVFGLISNHPFVDGNKRVGVTAMAVFLHGNGIELDITNDELAALGLSLADGKMTTQDVTEWLRTRAIEA
ncbi:MAG: type II toxin-antitoxin system death-on-curing family toxin [Propionibacteriaceae bacterium]|nr:type II toxin-antitoxin system death-on-curing family toxin [Propionibacteriaceae bacterium]